MAVVTANTGSVVWNTNGAWVGGVQPTAADDVIIPATAVVTIPTATTVLGRSLTVSAGATLAWASTSAVLSLGDATAGAGNVAVSISATATITLTGIGILNLLSTSATQQTVTTNGKTLPAVTYGGTGSSYLWGDAQTYSGTWTTTAGTVNTGNFNATVAAFVTSSAVAKTLTLGSSIITTTSTNTPINHAGSNLTLTANTSEVVGSPNANAAVWGGLTWNKVTFSGAGIAQTNTLACATFTRTGTSVVGDELVLQGNVTVSGTATLTGNSLVNRIQVRSQTPGSTRTFSAATFTVTNTDFSDITVSGAGSPLTGTSIGDCLGNTNITFTVNSGTSNGGNGVNRYWVGNAGSSGSTTFWSTTSGGSSGASIPLPQDDIYIDVNSFSTTGQRIQFNMPRIGRNVDTTGTNRATTTVSGSSGQNNTVYGNLTFAGTAIVDANSTGGWTFAGRGSHTINSNGGFHYGSSTVSAPGGTYTLVSDFMFVVASNRTLTFSYGTFVANTFNLYAQSYTIAATMTSVLMGSGTWTLGLATAGTLWTNSAAVAVVNAQTSTLLMVTSTGARTFAGGVGKYNILTYTVAGSTGALTLSGTAYYDTINFSDATNARTLTLTVNTLTTVRSLNIQGTSGKLMTINSTTGGTSAYLELVGSVTTVDFLAVQDIFSTIPYKFYAGANSTNTSGNTNVVFTAPVTQPYINMTARATNNSNAQPAPFSFSGSATAGNLLFYLVNYPTAPGVVTAPTGFTLVDSSGSGANGSNYTFYKVAAGGETTASASSVNVVSGWYAELQEIAGFSGTPTLDVKDKNNTGGANATSLSTGAGVTNTYNPAYAIATWSASAAIGANVSITNSFQESRGVTIGANARVFALPLTSIASQTTTLTWTTTRIVGSQLVIFGASSATQELSLMTMGMGS